MPAVFLAGGALHVIGDDPGRVNDTAVVEEVGANVRVTLNGIPRTFPTAAFGRISMDMRTGFDTVHLRSAPAVPVVVRGGTQDDAVHVGAGDLDVVRGTVTVAGDDGFDSVLVHDDSTGFADRYEVTLAKIDRTASNPAFNRTVNYGTVEAVVLDAQNGSNTITVASSDANTFTTINAGGGDDAVAVGTGNWDAVRGGVRVDGQAGTNTLTVDDGAAPFSDNYAVGTAAVTRTAPNPVFNRSVSYFGISELALNAPDGNNTITVASAAGGTRMLVDAGGGDDTVDGGGGDDILVGGDGDDTLRGQAGRDLLIGGDGADRFFGGGGDDLIVGGPTIHDADPTALRAIRAEWTSARDYFTRVQNIRGVGAGPRLNGSYFLNGATTSDDGDLDVMQGEADRDWFHVRGADQHNRAAGESLN